MPLDRMEGVEQVEIDAAKPEDFGGTLRVQYLAALENYTNRRLGITTSDIKSNYSDALRPDNIKTGEDKWRNLPENPNKLHLVAKKKGKVVGFCIIDRLEDRNQISSLYIDPHFQRKGLGEKFWDRAREFINPTKNTVVMVLPYNEKAIGFYESIGFEKTDRQAHDGEGTKLHSGAIMPVPIEMLRKADVGRK